MIRAFLEFHGVFGIPPAAKWDRPATTWMSPANRRWCGKVGMNGVAGGVGQWKVRLRRHAIWQKVKADILSAFFVEPNLCLDHYCSAAAMLHSPLLAFPP
jgi:hypothetical protein